MDDQDSSSNSIGRRLSIVGAPTSQHRFLQRLSDGCIDNRASMVASMAASHAKASQATCQCIPNCVHHLCKSMVGKLPLVTIVQGPHGMQETPPYVLIAVTISILQMCFADEHRALLDAPSQQKHATWTQHLYKWVHVLHGDGVGPSQQYVSVSFAGCIGQLGGSLAVAQESVACRIDALLARGRHRCVAAHHLSSPPASCIEIGHRRDPGHCAPEARWRSSSCR